MSYVKVYESGWEESTAECHYNIVNIKAIIAVLPMLKTIEEDEYGNEKSKELPECNLILSNGRTVYANMTASEFAERYLAMKGESVDGDKAINIIDPVREDMSKIIRELSEENVDFYDQLKYYKRFIETRGLAAEFNKYKLSQRNKEKIQEMYKDNLPFN